MRRRPSARCCARSCCVELRTLRVGARRCRCSRSPTFVRLPLRRSTATRVDGDLAAGVLWVTLLFAAMLGVNRLFVAEREQGGFDGFLLAPVDRTALLRRQGAGAVRSSSSLLELVAVPAFALLLLGPVARARRCPSCSACSRSATSASPRSARSWPRWPSETRARDLLGPLLALPLLVPVADRAARAPPRRCCAGGSAEALPARWLAMLGLYDLVFGLLAYAVFDFLLED